MNVLNTYSDSYLCIGYVVLIIMVMIGIGVMLAFRVRITDFLNLKFGFKKVWNLVPYILTTILLVALVGFGPMFTKSSTYVECTIDHDYSVVDLYEHYEILERRGDIWVLRQLSEPEEVEK